MVEFHSRRLLLVRVHVFFPGIVPPEELDNKRSSTRRGEFDSSTPEVVLVEACSLRPPWPFSRRVSHRVSRRVSHRVFSLSLGLAPSLSQSLSLSLLLNLSPISHKSRVSHRASQASQSLSPTLTTRAWRSHRDRREISFVHGSCRRACREISLVHLVSGTWPQMVFPCMTP